MFVSEDELVAFIKKELDGLEWLEKATSHTCVFHVQCIQTLDNLLNNYGEDYDPTARYKEDEYFPDIDDPFV